MRLLNPLLTKSTPYTRPFWLTRWRLTTLYASAMGVILTASAIGFYWATAQDHRREIDHRLETIASTLHDSLEPALDQPGQIPPLVLQILPDLCVDQTPCSARPERHVLGLLHQQGYYLRLLNLSGQEVATAGDPPNQIIHSSAAGLSTLAKADGVTYRQMSLWVAGVAIRPAYRAYQHIQQFTADAAHELRTPLATIRLSTESASRGEPMALTEAQGVLQVVHRQTQRLTTLVSDLLILSRLEQADDRSAPTLVYLPDLVQDIAEEFAALALTKEIHLATVTPDAKTLTVRGHESELYRMLLNLVGNALEYTPKGGIVTLRLTQRDRYALIDVEDTGIGIAPPDQTKIFDRFYRVNPDRSRHTGGSGLGLAIAQAIAQAHGGEMQVKSEIGKGSCFTIQLPRSA